MRGEQHALISILSACLVLLPWMQTVNPELVLIAIGGIFVGSLAPDADAPDAAILHGLRGGTGVLRQIRKHTVIALPVIGIIIRYFIYFPISAAIYVLSLGRIRPHHRGLLHSLPGITLITLVLAVYILLIASWAGLDARLWILVFSAGFFSGCLLHLLEDAVTKSGIAWWYPLSDRRMRGNISTGGRLEKRPSLLAAFLGGSTFLFLIAGPILDISPCMVRGGAILLLTGSWMFFFASAGVCRQ